MGSRPTVAMSSPKTVDMSPLSMEPRERVETNIRPTIATTAISALLNFTAILAIWGANRNRASQPIRPPMLEEATA